LTFRKKPFTIHLLNRLK